MKKRKRKGDWQKQNEFSSLSYMAGSYEIYLLQSRETEPDGPKLKDHVV